MTKQFFGARVSRALKVGGCSTTSHACTVRAEGIPAVQAINLWRVISSLLMVAVLVFACMTSLVQGLTTPTLVFADTSDQSQKSDPYREKAKADKQAEQQAKEQQQTQSAQEQADGAAADKPDGTYYGSAEGYQSIITVAVTVQGGHITDIKVVSHADDQSYVDRATKVEQSIIAAQSTDVDTVSGVTYSSTGILNATKDALAGGGVSSATNSVWFGVGMIVIAALLFVAACFFAKRWFDVRRIADRSRDSRLQRWCIQIMFFILAPSSFASGYMGLKSLFMQIQVMTTQRGYEFELASFTILLFALLALTVLLGRYFCGYVCAFGFVGDVLFRLSVAVTDKLKIRRRPLPTKLERVLRCGKYVVLIGECVLILMGFMMWVSENSPWSAYSSVIGFMFECITVVGGVLLVIIVIGMVWKERCFCEFLCPLGAVYSLMPTFPTGRMRRERPKCLKNCSVCKDHCPVNIEPKGRLLAGECLMCGRCADGCPVHNVTCGLEARSDELARRAGADVKFEGEQDAEGHEAVHTAHEKARRLHEFLTSRSVSVLWKAVLFLAVLWLMHATKYLPII